ncbi:hypothetical protein EMCRGX_G018832 [Ephydatia muelleri]|eukprot:Em0011g1161a
MAAEKQLLGIKVMRITRPSLMTSVPVMGEPWDMLGKLLEDESSRDVCSTRNLPFFSVGEALTLPQNFGTIFLGETFNWFVAFLNESQELLRDVVMKVELLTPTNRVSLFDKNVAHMDPEANEDKLVSYEVKELGDHSLTCTAAYTVGANGLELVSRKIFKFFVSKPLDVKTRFAGDRGNILLEVQIQNAMPHTMHLDLVNFDPAAGLSCINCNTMSSCDRPVFGDDGTLAPKAIRQYVYCISVPAAVQASTPPGKPKTVGKMDIVWRTKLGERGRIQTGQLKTTIPPLLELALIVLKSPGTVHTEQTFPVTCLITNNSGHSMRLKMVLDRVAGGGVVWSGVSGKILDELASKHSTQITLTALSVLPGLQSFAPLCLVDLQANQKHYNFSDIGQVFVEHLQAPSVDRTQEQNPLS